MRKLSKLLFMVFACSVLISLCFGGVVSAKEYGGKWAGSLTWSVDVSKETLTISGEGSTEQVNESTPWIPYLDQIKNIVLGEKVVIGTQHFAFVLSDIESFSQPLSGGFSWRYKPNEKTLYLDGTGALILNKIPWDNITRYGTMSNALSADTLILSDGITEYFDGSSVYGEVYLGAQYKTMSQFPFATEAYSVSPKNRYFCTFQDALYSKNYDTFIASPQFNVPTQFHHNTKIIGEKSFLYSAIPEDNPFLIIPWGVTHIEEQAIYVQSGKANPTIVLPDTLTNIHPSIGETNRDTSGKRTFIFSKNNKVAKAVLKQTDTVSIKILDSLSDYYQSSMPEDKPSLAKGWVLKGANWYYYFEDGTFATGSHSIDGIAYYFDPSSGILQGVPQEKPLITDESPDDKPIASGNSDGWRLISNEYFYYKDGKPLTMGWVQSENKWYYIRKGRFVTGFLTINNHKYYLNKNGVMLTGLQQIDGKTYCFEDASGRMEHSKWKQMDGNWYYLNAYGAGMVKYWALSGGKWFYLKEDGKMATNQWVEWYSKWYYVGSDGAMYVNRKTPDGRYVDGSGVRIR